jgi:hypothetical protein
MSTTFFEVAHHITDEAGGCQLWVEKSAVWGYTVTITYTNPRQGRELTAILDVSLPPPNAYLQHGQPPAILATLVDTEGNNIAANRGLRERLLLFAGGHCAHSCARTHVVLE